MNKIISICLMLLLGTLVFAEDIIVQSVIGKVTMESGLGKWIAVKAGDKLTLETLINTGLNSKLIFKIGERLVTVNPMTKKTIAALIGISTPQSVTAVKNVQNTDINATSNQSSTNIPTASTRASDATGDVDWEEDQ